MMVVLMAVVKVFWTLQHFGLGFEILKVTSSKL